MSLVMWFFILSISIIISTFIHEIGHGLACYLQGIPVSTGFNRVGDVYKKPSDPDFRTKLVTNNITCDLGVPITLILAIVSTVLLYLLTSDIAIIIASGLAVANSFLRLIPMVNILAGLLFKGELVVEDEVGLGRMWYNKFGYQIFEYIPLIISTVVSVICYYFTYKSISNNEMIIEFNSSGYTITTIFAFLVSFKILNKLDDVIRINWN